MNSLSIPKTDQTRVFSELLESDQWFGYKCLKNDHLIISHKYMMEISIVILV